MTSINADQNNFIRRSSLPTSPTGTMMESGAEDKSQPGIYTNDNNIGKLNSPESMASRHQFPAAHPEEVKTHEK